jgi:carbon-monoxide dehydrogenase medium subunit
MSTVREYLRPTSVPQAVEMIRSAKGRGGYIAGGTFLGRARQIPYDVLIDITGLGLEAIRTDQGRVRLGATATIQDLVDSDIVSTPQLELLGRAARTVAGRQIRNIATVAGDLISGYLMADLPAPLLVLGAELVVAGDENRPIPLEAYYSDRSARRPKDWLITEIVFPMPPPEARGVFIKFARTAHDVAIADVACQARIVQGRFQGVRLAVSAAVNRPRRLTAAERFLENRPADRETCRAAAERVLEDLSLLDNVRAGRAYRERLLPVLIRRALMNCIGGGEEER